MRLIILIFLSALPFAAIASDFGPGPCGEPEIYEESSAFVFIPTQIGGCAVGIPSTVVGAVVGGTAGMLLLPSGENPIDYAGIGMLFFANGGNYLGGAIVGLPFWAVEQLLYQLPKKGIAKITQSKSAAPAKDSAKGP